MAGTFDVMTSSSGFHLPVRDDIRLNFQSPISAEPAKTCDRNTEVPSGTAGKNYAFRERRFHRLPEFPQKAGGTGA